MAFCSGHGHQAGFSSGFDRGRKLVHFGILLNGCTCGPPIPGEFDYTGYPRHDSGDHRSAPSRPSSQKVTDEDVLLARRQPRAKTHSDAVFLAAALRANCLFRQVDNDAIKQLVDGLEYHEVYAGDRVITEGSVGSRFYLAHGVGLETVLRGVTVSSMPAGQTFGELSLLHKCPHTCSVVATRRVGVWAAASDKFRQAILSAVKRQVSEVRAFLEEVPLLQNLSARELDCVSDMSYVRSYAPGDKPLQSGVELTHAFFVMSGQLKSWNSPGKEEELLQTGQCIGERLLLYGDASAANLEVTKRCDLVFVNARKMRQLLGKQEVAIKLQQPRLMSSLRSSPALSEQPQSLVAQLAKSLELSEYMPGAKIPPSIGLFVVLDGDVQAGQRPSARILRAGTVEVPPAAFWTQGGTADRRVLGSAHECHFVAGHTGCRLAVLPALRADDAAGMKARVLNVLSRVSIFRQVQEATLDVLFQCVKTQLYRNGEQIVQQGEKASHFYVIATGEVDMVKDGHSVRRLVQGGCFGERAVLFAEPWSTSFTVVAAECEVWFWDRNTLLQALAKESRASEQLRQRASLQDPGVGLQDLKKLGQVGTGTSGTVWLVTNVKTDARYALKRVKTVDGKVPQEVQREIQILSENDHPFLMQMVKSMQTHSHIYVLAEYVGGGELYAAMRSISTVFSRQQAMFCVGSLLLMLEALHERNVVYRDLKPENIMLDAEGYLKLVDFGTAKKLEAKCGRTFTLVGTTHYMAPEVMRGKGYGLEVDVWALGIVLYELLCGHLPFGENADNPREVCRAVLAGSPALPQHLEPCARVLIVSLLEPRPRRRLGCGANGLQDIKDSAFFQTHRGRQQSVQSTAFDDSVATGSHSLGTLDFASPELDHDDYFTMLLSRKVDPPLKAIVAQESDKEGEALTDCEEILCNGANGKSEFASS
ncbi:egl-4 [Symbiodinium sp. CCMP2592]|nr:egl-4 [Symbiodinium sp. CCMP2592]